VSTIADFMASTEPAPPPDPTPEQQAIVDMFAAGESFKVEAGAGTGKTTTLGMVARSTHRRGLYLAFNKAIVVEAGAKMPSNVRCSTAHSLAWHAVCKGRYEHRLNADRMRSGDIARLLNLKPLRINAGGHHKFLAPWRLAGIVMRTVTRFAQSADLDVTTDHVPHMEGLDWGGTGDGNAQLAAHILPATRTAWADLASIDGYLPFKHEHYLKLWQLSDPRIEADFICFDEAQDANPVMASVVAGQDHAQLGWIGDTQQQIYAFTGAINALAGIDADHTLYLTQSWRFGPAIAEAANGILTALRAELRLVGLPGHDSEVRYLRDDEVRAVLCRTNARAMEEVITQVDRGRRPHLIGGGKEIIDFARGAADLQAGKKSWHPDLACFDDWTEVLEYVEDDAQGGELALLVSLVVRFGASRLIAILRPLPAERDADLIISTAHKAKGREWSTVRLAEDLEVEPDDELQGGLPPEELRLLYVAATRARDVLDPSGVSLEWPWLDEIEVAPC
jgi:hypothetical protein